MGRRCDRSVLPERPAVAARPRLQCDQREGNYSVEIIADAEGILGVGSDADAEREWLLPIHAGNESALWIERISRHAAGRRPGECFRAAPASRRSDASSRERL